MSRELKGVVPVGQEYIRTSIQENDNIFGVREDKGAWAKNLNIPRNGDYTFFAGCGYQLMKYAGGMMIAVQGVEKMGVGMDKTIGIARVFKKVGVDLPSITGKIMSAGKDDPYTRVLVSTVNVLRKLNVNFGYMGDDEPCCGSPLYYAGFADDFAENAQRSYERLKSGGATKVIGVMPACTASLRDGYRKFVKGYDLEVKHFIQIVAQRLKETGKKPRLKEKMVVTYHDPCQLSRYLGIIAEPREVMASIEGLELREPGFFQSGLWSTCCGGGGGMEMVEPELCERVAVARVEELLATGAPNIVTSCPACVMQLLKGARRLKSNVKVMDLAEVLDQALE